MQANNYSFCARAASARVCCFRCWRIITTSAQLRKADEFERRFGGLAIGANPTPLHSQYFVLKWDFSGVNPQGDAEAVERGLNGYLNSRIEDFAIRYETRLPRPIKLDPTIALISCNHCSRSYN
jgi:hypothetical protein